MNLHNSQSPSHTSEAFLCIRVDLDYVPWDTPDAQQFGHGEPAMVLRLLELGRRTGTRWHFFASERALRAFPAEADAVLNDGHDLDYLAKHPSDAGRWSEAQRLFSSVGHSAQSWAIRGSWPTELVSPPGIDLFSGPADSSPPGRLFPIKGRSLHDAVRQGAGLRTWVEETFPMGNAIGGTIVVSPQVLARVDPRLAGIEELLSRSRTEGVLTRTLRELNRSDRT